MQGKLRGIEIVGYSYGRWFLLLPVQSLNHNGRKKGRKQPQICGRKTFSFCTGGSVVEHRAVTREVLSSTPTGPTLRLFKITEEKVLPLELHQQMVRLSSLLG